MGFLTWAILVILVVGINLIFWGLIGLSRYISELFPGIIHKIKKGEEPPRSVNRLSPDEVAVIVPAHNEELVIKETIRSLLDIINRQHIFVVSDGSKDRTVEIVRELGVKVIDLTSSIDIKLCYL
jgi:cellulose synthase/poly-beta-1,6-N-acetylglucosamine synthase-like glycosyltransferase